MVSGLIFGGLFVIMGNAANWIFCIAFYIIDLPNHEVFVFPDFENCGR